MSLWGNSRRQRVLLVCLLLLASLAAVGGDRITLKSDSTLFCRIRREGADSVSIAVGKQDTVLPRPDIAGITYARNDFETPCRLATFGMGYEVRRGGNVVEFDKSFDLLQGDTLNAGPDGHMGVVFAGGMQLSVRPGGSVVLSKTGWDKSNKRYAVEIRLLKGSVCAGAFSPQEDRIDLAVHSPNSTIRSRGTVFITQYQDEEQVTQVGVSEGTVGVRLLGSDIGEVVVNAGECVRMSGLNKKIMQDELTEELSQELAEVSQYFSGRTVAEVKEPKKREKKEEKAEDAERDLTFCFMTSDVTLNGRRRFWIVPQAGSDLAAFADYHKFGGVAKLAVGYNPLPWLLPYVQAGYRMTYYQEILQDDFEYIRMTQQMIASAGLTALFERRRIFSLIGLSSTYRMYARNEVNSQPVEAPDKHVIQANLDACGGLRFPIISLYSAYRLMAHSSGWYNQLGAGLTFHVLNNRILIGTEAQLRMLNDGVEVVLLMNLGCSILNQRMPVAEAG